MTTFVFSPAFASNSDEGGTSADGHNHGGAEDVSAGAGAGHAHGKPVDDKGLALLSQRAPRRDRCRSSR